MMFDRFAARPGRGEQDVFLFATGELEGWRKAALAVRAVFDPRLRRRLAAVAGLSAQVGTTVRGEAWRAGAPYLRTVWRAKLAVAIGLATSAGTLLAYRLASTADACEPFRVQTATVPPAGTTAGTTAKVQAEHCLENSEVVSE